MVNGTKIFRGRAGLEKDMPDFFVKGIRRAEGSGFLKSEVFEKNPQSFGNDPVFLIGQVAIQ